MSIKFTNERRRGPRDSRSLRKNDGVTETLRRAARTAGGAGADQGHDRDGTGCASPATRPTPTGVWSPVTTSRCASSRRASNGEHRGHGSAARHARHDARSSRSPERGAHDTRGAPAGRPSLRGCSGACYVAVPANSSTIRRASSSWYCTGGDFMKYADGPSERATDAAVERELAAAHRVDDHAGRVRRVPHLELELDVERHVAEVAALEADVGPLAVVEPRHVVGRADVHVVGLDALVDLARDRLRLRDLLRLAAARARACS